MMTLPRRVMLLIAVALVMAAIMIASGLPASASNSKDQPPGPPTYSGMAGKSGNGGGAVIHTKSGGNMVFNKNGFNCHKACR